MLPNGLTVVLEEDHSTPIVHLQLWYHVGSKNEKPGRTGFAHLFEHLMFKGSKNVSPEAHTSMVASVGGQLVATKGVSASFEFVGRVKAIEKVDVRARVEGFLEKVLFRDGQDVKTGDVLYQIEKVQFQAAVEQAEGNLLIAEATETNAKLEYNRQLDLVKRQYTSQ